ncbi:hypothetical protein [Streptacidiphilus fuscans]|uniref:Uncharacterized protein n=1 Tax=Streptacidiphilus fuscans TaxID=2789292 RepID=A0A931B8R1_9ACTN|nr:hypothetical protein [Streptacidiphilus fuscans]MBF9072564.1 hypothetical protein [Streptacidiphilus fuscans]
MPVVTLSAALMTLTAAALIVALWRWDHYARRALAESWSLLDDAEYPEDAKDQATEPQKPVSQAA